MFIHDSNIAGGREQTNLEDEIFVIIHYISQYFRKYDNFLEKFTPLVTGLK